MSSTYRWTLTNLADLSSEVLALDPIGWDSSTYHIGRDPVYKGAFHQYTTSLKFHCNGGGKDFIDAVYASDDIDGRIDLTCEYKCNESGSYETLFSGIINLASYKTDGEYTDVNIEYSDLLTKLKNREDIDVDLDTGKSIGHEVITVVPKVTLPMPHQEISLIDKMELGATTTFTHTYPNVADSILYKGLRTHSMKNDSTELFTWIPWANFDDYGHPGYSDADSIIMPVYIANDTNVAYPNTIRYTINTKGTFSDLTESIVTKVATANTLVLAYGADLATATKVTICGNSYSSASNPYTHVWDTGGDVTADITLNSGDSIWLYWAQSETITTGPYTASVVHTYAYDNFSFELLLIQAAPDSKADSFLVHEAFNQVIDAIADSDGNFYSEFFGRTDSEKQTYSSDGCGSHMAITSGVAIRSMPDAKVYCSLKKLFQSLNCVHNIGLGMVSGKIRVEPLSYWYNNTKLLTCANVNQYSRMNDNARYINKVEVGYVKWGIEYRQGRDEVCTNHQYSTDVASVKGTYSALSEYVSSGYAIEICRVKGYNLKPTEDYQYDELNFFVACVPYYRGQVATIDDTISIPQAISGIQAGDSVTLSGTTYNDGTYTVSTATVYQNNDGSYYTYIVLTASLPHTALIIDLNVTFTDNTNRIWKPEKYADSFSNGANMTSLDTAFNLRFTPARMLLAHMNVLTPGLQKINGKVYFVRGEGNVLLTTQLADNNCQADYNESIAYVSNILAENQDFDWNDANVHNITPIYLPEIYEFEYPITYAEFKTIQANPYGYVEFYKKSTEVFQGYIETLDYSLKTGLAKFKLIKRYQ